GTAPRGDRRGQPAEAGRSIARDRRASVRACMSNELATKAPAILDDDEPEVEPQEGEAAEGETITTDDLFGATVDEEKSEKLNKEVLLPTGTWITKPPVKFQHERRAPKEGPYAGQKRLTHSAFVQIELRDRTTGEVKEKGSIRLSMS